ncbi:MAG: TIR domain-containing protein [Gammaproteobacteria bacterium]|nr:TIR domain-containing protein [Gammaproteobacteria bacterium]
MANVFISYTQREPDYSLAKTFFKSLKDAGHTPFLASESIRIGEDWPIRIKNALEQSDYFLLFLSAQSLHSDMVTEEVCKARALQQTRSCTKPVMLPIRVNLPFDADTNYDLAGYLNRIQQRLWHSEADTAKIIAEILSIIKQGTQPELLDEAAVQVRSSGLRDVPPPNAPLELPEGQVRLDSPFYISRSSDADCLNEILKPGALVRIKAPRQFGKTSLLSRLIQHAKANKHHIVSLSLQLLDEASIANLETFLKQLCLTTARKLKLLPNMEEYWVEYEAVKMRCSTYFEEYILEETDAPVVLALDEADRLFSYKQVSDDFFGLLRFWHEQSKVSPLWEKLKLIVVHSTEPYLGITNINQSPFYNVGLEGKLAEFDASEIGSLVEQHGLKLNQQEINQLIELVGGHPYLIRRALYELAHTHITLQEFIKIAPTNEGPFSDHLRRNLLNLSTNSELAKAMHQIAKDRYYKDAFICYRLEAAGLIKGEFPDVRPRCELYTRYFQNRL